MSSSLQHLASAQDAASRESRSLASKLSQRHQVGADGFHRRRKKCGVRVSLQVALEDLMAAQDAANRAHSAASAALANVNQVRSRPTSSTYSARTEYMVPGTPPCSPWRRRGRRSCR